ncbi:sugar-binding transcriptional regulator [Exiguobacterium marinum]|uniref:Sugar-binding transcriptional regulator n=1 Tax=Exiguobacterium marinum TaxID=273528 RepID=A0ABY7X084_9BACL|nr:sugar-binding transcriptional regulator [Exiguobacterium marinum]WDH76250.1 sugar-binding transcriptional regulator [Exiguobacterium marinum]
MSEELKRLYEVAHLYYEQNQTQHEIAETLDVNRATISRMLKRIRELGIVKFQIDYDRFQSIDVAVQLKEQFGLKHVILVPEKSGQREETLQRMGEACATYVESMVTDEDVIGFSWGTALATVVEALTPKEEYSNIQCVPLIGGPDGKLESRFHANTLAYDASRKWRGRSKLIDVPAILPNAAIKQALTQSTHAQEVVELWGRMNIALFGIGSAQLNQESNWLAFYGQTFTEEMNDLQIVGDICSNFYNQNGELMTTSLSDRTVHIEHQQLAKVPLKIGVAYGSEKVDAIRVAAEHQLLDVIVTTDRTAQQLLQGE